MSPRRTLLFVALVLRVFMEQQTTLLMQRHTYALPALCLRHCTLTLADHPLKRLPLRRNRRRRLRAVSFGRRWKQKVYCSDLLARRYPKSVTRDSRVRKSIGYDFLTTAHRQHFIRFGAQAVYSLLLLQGNAGSYT